MKTIKKAVQCEINVKNKNKKGIKRNHPKVK